MTAAISNGVAEKDVCWCEGRKKRRSLIMAAISTLARRTLPGAQRKFPSKPTRAFHPLPSLSSENYRNGSLIDTAFDFRPMTSHGNKLRINDLPVDLELSPI